MRMGVRFLACLTGVLLIAGCASTNDPYAIMAGFAPNTPRPFPNPRPKPEAPRARPQAPAAVAQRTAPVTSSRLAAPVADTVVVRRGDTVYALARRHGRTARDLIDANDLEPPYTLFPGQRLRLNVPRYHVVKRGDTGYGISRKYGVELTTLMRSNDLKAPYTLHVGQRLIIPGIAAANQSSAPPRLVAVPPPPKRSSSRFSWPVQGTVISRFGPKEGGRHNDGINIRAPMGAPVRAAENGVVAYAGNDLRGFGNLLLIRHDGGWVTAYGHNQTLLVKRGDTVKRGQVIAHVGDSGTSGGPQLHFEIRRGTKAVNPERYL
jgi:murein DD-endopeptidase MepM/ murein hydrolase activator NlpD